MDRIETYVGQSILEWNFSKPDQNKMVALGKIIASLFGTGTVVSGLACAQQSVANMTVSLAAGEIYQQAQLEATACGTLPADTSHQISKQGIQLDSLIVPNAATGITAFVAPGTTGQSINYLIQVAYADLDVSIDPTTGASPVVLPFFNATNSQSPLQGPGGTGATSNTFRKGIVNVQVKAGTAATTGSQATPAPDSGFVGLWVVTVAFGQTTITNSNIAQYAAAPVLPASLLSSIQNGALGYGIDVGTVNTVQAVYPIPPTALADNQPFWVKIKVTNTGAMTFTPNAGVVAAAPVIGLAQAALQGGEVVANGRALFVWRNDISSFVLEFCSGGALQVQNASQPLHALNQATGDARYALASSTLSQASIQGAFKNLQSSATGLSATVTETVDEIVVESAANVYATLRAVSLSGALTASGANGLDNSAPQTATVTIASPGVFTQNNHGFPVNAAVVPATTGALPTGFTAGTTYYVVNPTTNTYQLAATKGGAAINTSGSQSGIHTIASVLAFSSWYSKWQIWNGTTAAILFSSSATNPALPTGYTSKARTGWVYTDSVNKYPLGFTQRGRRVRYLVGSTTNLTSLPQMVSGVSGSVTVPTWTPVPVGSYSPPTAGAISIVVSHPAGGTFGNMAAPNSSYGATGSTTNPAPLVAQTGSNGSTVIQTDMILESANIFYAANNAGDGLFCFGWEDNI